MHPGGVGREHVFVLGDLDIGTRATFLDSAPNHEVSSSYVASFRSYRVCEQTDKQTDAAENMHRAVLCYAMPVGKYIQTYQVSPVVKCISLVGIESCHFVVIIL